MTIPKRNFDALKCTVFFALSLLFAARLTNAIAAQSQDDQAPGSRHLCAREAIRKDGTCDPKPGAVNSKLAGDAKKGQPRYKRVAKQSSTTAKCNGRVKETQTAKNQSRCELPTVASKEDLPLDSSQRVGVTFWRVREGRRDYEGARLLSHPKYQFERIEGDPVVTYGERVRMGIESPRDGYLYVFDRELYHDGSLSAPYMIFPTSRLRDGDNRIRANSPIEIPAATDNPIYFEAKTTGLDPRKRLVGEILSIAITDKPISSLRDFGSEATLVSTANMESIENLYAGRAEVFELEDGVGRAYSTVERDAALSAGSRMLTHADPVPQTFFLVENKRSNGLLVTVALKYQGSNARAFAQRR
jgi:hypothetical protein